MKDVYDILREWQRRRGERFALATLVHAEGSSYRRPGARMLIREDGGVIGSLSAGCLEEEVTRRALEVLETGNSALMSFDTRRRFGCSGKIEISIEREPENFFIDLAENLDARRACVAITRFSGEVIGTRIAQLDHDQGHKHSGTLVQEIHPPIRLFIFGGGRDGAPMHLFGKSLGWETFDIINANELPIVPDKWTAAIVKSHNYGHDFGALQKLLPLELRYVGLIGPRKRRNQLLSHLLDLGVTINAGFFAPAGLDLAAETPEEIALAIIAEIQRVFAGGSGQSLRERKTQIHAALECADPTLAGALSKR